jgi:hypothetical protein
MIAAPQRALATSTAILGFPVVMGKILSNEKWAYWLAEGVKHPAAMKKYVNLVATEMIRYGARPDVKAPDGTEALPKRELPRNLFLSMPKM